MYYPKNYSFQDIPELEMEDLFDQGVTAVFCKICKTVITNSIFWVLDFIRSQTFWESGYLLKLIGFF